MGLDIKYHDGQTPLDEDEKDGLLIPSIYTRESLDEFEQQNIEKAIEWTYTSKVRKEELFTEKYIRTLHRKMFGSVWKWAGEFRRTEKSIGIDPVQIAISVKQLCDDALYQIDHKIYSEVEIAIRFKYELVKIHCFANGNGRHSRLIADVIISHIFSFPVFTWGNYNSFANPESRNNYLLSLRKADKGDIADLIEFAIS